MFSEFNLDQVFPRNLRRMGYTAPTPVQSAAIPLAMAGRDLIVTAETGSGKTAAFLLPILDRMLAVPGEGVKGLVICPTREIALQVQEQASLLSAGTRLRSLPVYGGVGMTPQLAGLKAGVDLVVATPGRLLDHIWRGSFNPDHLRFLILDEADRMLDMGFLPDLRKIISCLPEERQTMLFSATMPPEIEEIAARFLRRPERLTVGRPATPPGAIEQRIYPVPAERKTDLLLKLLGEADAESVLVFVRTKHRAERIARQLQRNMVNAARIHGDRSQVQRETALDGFRRGRFKVLVATDVAARGLDIKAVTHVINYDLPNCAEDYVHRIGRTARAGASGNAWSLMTAEDARILKDIEKTVGRGIERVVLPEYNQASTSGAARGGPRRARLERIPRTGSRAV